MKTALSRRSFLRSTALVTGASLASIRAAKSIAADAAEGAAFDFPIVDLHVHLDNSTIDKVAALSKERGIQFGIVEHAGTEENKYPVVLSSDAELKGYLDMLEGKAAFKGVQAEWTDWYRCFSPKMLARLDYVLTDAMTFPDKNGKRFKLWEPGFDFGNPQVFMDRFVDWHVEIMAQQPIDILGNTSWLPGPLANDYDANWTDARMAKVIDAALKYGVAFEISSSFKLPKLKFLKAARDAGIKFIFGSNGRYPNMGKLDYSIAMAKELGLKKSNMFTPAPDGQKAVQRRKYA